VLVNLGNYIQGLMIIAGKLAMAALS
jgi:hypothetical protein